MAEDGNGMEDDSVGQQTQEETDGWIERIPGSTWCMEDWRDSAEDRRKWRALPVSCGAVLSA